MGKRYLGLIARKHFNKFATEISPCYENNHRVHRDEIRFSRVPRSHKNRTKLFDLSKYFLASRDNIFPHEQALSRRAGIETTH